MIFSKLNHSLLFHDKTQEVYICKAELWLLYISYTVSRLLTAVSESTEFYRSALIKPKLTYAPEALLYCLVICVFMSHKGCSARELRVTFQANYFMSLWTRCFENILIIYHTFCQIFAHHLELQKEKKSPNCLQHINNDESNT